MKRIVVLIAVSLFVFGSTISGIAAETAGTDLEQTKATITADIDQMIKLLQTEKQCVAAATTKDEIKKCHEPVVAKRKETRKTIKDMRRKGIIGPMGVEQGN